MITRRDLLKGLVGAGALALAPSPAYSQEAHLLEDPLEERIEEYIAACRGSGDIASDEHTSWSVYDFTTGEKPVSVNEDVPRQAASMFKPFVVLAYLNQVERGRRNYDRSARRNAEFSIRDSNNVATNELIRSLGGPSAVQNILTEQYGGILRGVSIVEEIPLNGATYANMATAHDYSRFLYALQTGEWALSPQRTEEMRRLLSLQPRGNRIYTGAGRVPEGTRFVNKTGSTARLCGDFGILFRRGNDGREYPYTVIGIIEKDRRAPEGSLLWCNARGGIIRDVSSLVYDEMKRRHDLI